MNSPKNTHGINSGVTTHHTAEVGQSHVPDESTKTLRT